MRPFSNQVRFGRFSVSHDADVQLTVQKRMGGSARFTVLNVSPAGLGAMGTSLDSDDTGFAVGDIIPSSRLRFLDHDVALGRVICRYINKREGLTLCGFSLIDVKVPLGGPISQLLNGYAPKGDRPPVSESDRERFRVVNFATAKTSREELAPDVRRFVFYKRA
jgi:hypothetical protein